MITTTTTIQEITVQAYLCGTFSFLFSEKNMSRDEIFNLFEKWGVEFEERHRDFEWNGECSYYDEIDDFVQLKSDELKTHGYTPVSL